MRFIQVECSRVEGVESIRVEGVESSRVEGVESSPKVMLGINYGPVCSGRFVFRHWSFDDALGESFPLRMAFFELFY